MRSKTWDWADTEERPAPHLIEEREAPEPVAEVMDVHSAAEMGGVRVFRGRLRVASQEAFERLKRALAGRAIPMLQPDEKAGAAIVLVPRAQGEEAASERPIRPWLHWLLFGLTLITTTIAGAAHQGVNLLRQPEMFTVGLPYSLGLLSILGIHELGHYFTARHYGMSVTPPYFIPAPFALGTFGAFIQLRSPAENRRALFDVAVAGPLAGLVIAIPALLIGLRHSAVIPDAAFAYPGALAASVESSALFAVISKLALGDALEYGRLVRLSPLAFAGWLGLLVTALNLLPIGQLDGGHISRAMFGYRAGRIVSTVAMWTLLLVAVFFRPGLMMWAILVFFLAGRPIPPLDDLTPITRARMALGVFAFLILAAILAPVPASMWSAG
jgi:membrane-associated protease RseP (regulator of RpoE activity)